MQGDFRTISARGWMKSNRIMKNLTIMIGVKGMVEDFVVVEVEGRDDLLAVAGFHNIPSLVTTNPKMQQKQLRPSLNRHLSLIRSDMDGEEAEEEAAGVEEVEEQRAEQGEMKLRLRLLQRHGKGLEQWMKD